MSRRIVIAVLCACLLGACAGSGGAGPYTQDYPDGPTVYGSVRAGVERTRSR
ncbi:hypothetical protein [Plasticicumulans acidivorans]|uniref:Lipoprotein n=1 Tax=Plasticicumulans acidivorans TaxID=886464 RepID=A0A317MQR3_9GAMM|nr:hypothetical protein [Plasticicumulans acidivorans]PWV58393.1 hypothetical protein C7443_11825 [Plasticicumulans acidivorans]